MASLEDVSLLHVNSNTMTATKERLKSCCKPVYLPRRVKNKGATLVLIWNYLTMSVFYLINGYFQKRYYVQKACFGIYGITVLIAGWLADTRIGRYKVVRYGIWIMWLATVLATVSSVIANLNETYIKIDSILLQVALLVTAVGLGGFQANIIQFGMDQLHDASTTEIKSFIIWFVWTACSQGIPMDFTFACLGEEYQIFILLFVCANLSLAMILLHTCNNGLIKEPIQQNPLKLVYKVIIYAIKNKHPRQRSAFTYCEDELPSRIDFGKRKYGGPFTIEQVEDVKTFLRLLPVAIVGGALGGSIIISNTIRDKLYKQFTDLTESVVTSNEFLTKCYREASYTHTVYFGATLLIAFHETLIYPIFHRCSPRMESLHKMLVGMVVLIARVLTLMAYNVISRHNSLQINGPNITNPCLFDHETSNGTGAMNTSFNYRWITIPDFLSTVSLTMLYIGTIEFVSAQVPFFMKGLMIGMIYCLFYLSSALWLAVSLPFVQFRSIWGTGTISCGFWYTPLLLTVDVGIFLILALLTRWYKKRRRQDVLPNEHFFAERYYSAIT